MCQQWAVRQVQPIADNFAERCKSSPKTILGCGSLLKLKTMKILILNGANLNLQGKRDKGVYGCESFDTFIPRLQAIYSDIEIDYRQTNIEGEIVDYLHRAEGNYDGVLLNAGGYTHTSVVIRDAIAAIETPVVEIHISNIAAREEFRHTTLIGSVAIGSIVGFGLNSYRIGVEALKLHLQ